MIKPSAMRAFRNGPENEAGAALRRLAGWLVVVGLALRLFHYLRNYTIWYDESVLLFNILEKDYAQLVGPLDHAVAAPPLFVWLLHFIGTFADRPYLWRFLPFIGSCLLLLLTYRLAHRFLSPLAGAALVGLVTFSNAHVWLGCNIKPYIFDALISAALIYLYLATQATPLSKRLIMFALLAPPLMIFSYPAVFLYGGVMLAFLPAIMKERGSKVLRAYVLLGLAVGATFAALYFGPLQSQRVSGLVSEWANKFPPWHKPASVPGWIVGNFFLVCHYCYNPVGGLCIGLAVLGAIECRRGGRGDLILLLTGPIFLCLLVSCFRIYPFSGNRLIFFLAPGFGMLLALGVPIATDWLRRRTRHAVVLLLVAIVVPQGALAAYRVVRPWDHPNSSAVAEHIRQERKPGDLVASAEPGYRYFFRGELRNLSAMGTADLPSGQRVWVPVDYYPAPESKAFAQRSLPPNIWELATEVRFHRASLFLFVKR